MFTGLVDDLGHVVFIGEDGGGATLRVASQLAAQLRPGDSVSVSGVCLTAIDVNDEGFSAQAMHETLAHSSLSELRAGDAVNLELPLRADARLGGHIVQGHVDGVGRIGAVHEDGFARVLDVEVAPELDRYLVLKGSIAVDGVSLTVSGLREGGFSVSLIPETLQRTTLGLVAAGDAVNVEVDVLAKHVERLLAARVGAS